MPKTLDELQVDDLFEPCDRCKDAKESGVRPTVKEAGEVNQTKVFSLRDSASCPLCHGTKQMLNKHGVLIQRLALQLRDKGFLRPS